jgi:glycerate-2-kinase
MHSEATATVVKMIEALPEEVQERILEHLREYIEDIKDELRWDQEFHATHNQLVGAARRAREEIARGLAKPLDPDAL